MSLFEQISRTAHPDNHPQLRAKFEVTWEPKFLFGMTVKNHRDSMTFPNQTEARDHAKKVNGLYEVVIYIAGTRQVIYRKQY